MSKDNLKNIANDYFNHWESKNVAYIQSCFTEEAILIDPVVGEVKGLDAVVSVNKNIFDSTGSIKFLKKEIYVDHFSSTVIGELEIEIDGNTLNVTDIIHFSEDFKIKKLRAYFNA